MQKSTRNKLLVLFGLALAITLGFSISMERKLESTKVLQIERAFPFFTAEDLMAEDRLISRTDILTQPYQIVNVWASWCGICKLEHEYLNQLKNLGVPIIGINYRDNKLDAIKVIKNEGNPFEKIIYDHRGDLSIELGVIGTPETYLVDRNGNIRLKIMGVLNEDIWNEYLKSYFQGI
ncbi:DsbE family thiol:disulfide interchange protein [Vibrio makurazakiensis]|uniref:DsbE family thiol:disulfide interchange protein n=1 Tax=Vibrio makurazakiensis TaxID=2910250 RepID=UPI003D144B2A